MLVLLGRWLFYLFLRDWSIRCLLYLFKDSSFFGIDCLLLSEAFAELTFFIGIFIFLEEFCGLGPEGHFELVVGVGIGAVVILMGL